ncbi:MAG TPA: DUF1440 domain-containing protein [Bryobacteraceae bacterium]|nr:DUF1440 domain-containing protein [Bryobacteraceae bacterium]
MASAGIWKGIAAGALGGLTASWAMNQFQALESQTMKKLSNPDGQEKEESGESDEPATAKAANMVSEKTLDRELTPAEKKQAAPAVHYAFGTLTGAAYGALAQNLSFASSGYGTVFGSLLWLAADEVGVPALKLSKPPQEVPVSSHATALSSHLVYGIVTDAVRRSLMKM